jgi:hypothetical protein
MTLMAQTLGACSGLPLPTSSTAQYPNLNEPSPSRKPLADQEAAQAKAELTEMRDNQERAAASQQAFQ